MNIGRQWNDRLRIWAEQFEKHYVAPVAQLEVSYFKTMEHLPFADAVKGDFAHLPVGEKWGKKWEYAWFHTRVTIPENLAGKRLVFALRTAPEMLVWVNGAEAGAIDKKHTYITLTRSAVPGTVYDIYAEGYAGHGVRNEGAGIVAAGEESVPEPPEKQVTVGTSFYGVWNEELFQVAMDYLTLYNLVKKLPEKSLRTMKVVEGLKQFTYIADFELPEPQLTESVVEAGKVLEPLIACKNGSTAPEFTVFGQSHLDMAWLWPVEETMRKSARTYSNQLALMEEYDDFKFFLCEPPILEYLKTLYPNVWQRVKERVHSEHFLPEGAMWIESDTNIPSGESLIRQFVRGKRWFRNELGVDAKMAWMPDTFGFNGALPQIMKKCRIPYFATQKLVRQDPECEPFPYNIFWWEGIDGSKVLSHLFKKNNAVFNSGDLITRWEEDRIQQENIDSFVYPFGYGDGGGGPTREMVEMARRCTDLEGAPRCRMESPVKFFQRLDHVENTFRGELYLAWHRGTLTSQAKTKQNIRWAENALLEVEYFLSRQLLAGKQMPEKWRERLDQLWKTLLFNQFHDIATGASIRRVHETAVAQLQQVCRGCEAMVREILGETDPAQRKLAIYNPFSWDIIRRGVTIRAQSTGYIDYNVAAERSVRGCYLEEEGCYELSNRHIICRIDKDGHLISVKRPGLDREYMAGKGNRFLLFKDVNTCYDAWELGSMYENLPVELQTPAQVQLRNVHGEVELEITRRIGNSDCRQRVVLREDSKFLAFMTEIDWQEKHRMLKVAFPVNAHADEAYHEIQFGYVKRPTHRSYQTDKDRYEVCNHRYTALTDGAVGGAVLNDGKYGVNVVDNEIRLTLLKSTMMPDQNADRGIQYFTYAFYPFDGAFTDSDVPQRAMEMNRALMGGVAEFDADPVFLGNQRNIIVETVKPADCLDNALVVRAYEAMGKQTDCAFTVHPKVKTVLEADMLEENGQAVNTDCVHFGPFEIKTFILYL